MEPPIQDCKGMRWQVIFLLFSYLHYSVSGQIHYSIVEEMRKDSVIANIADDLGLDNNQLSSRKLRIVSRSAEKYFYINIDNGILYIKDRIDRETLCGAEASCFLTFDAVVENPFNNFNIRVDIQDINDNSPQFYHNSITLEIIEFTSEGSRFALQNAEDPDIGSNSVQTYKLSDNQYFTLTEDIRTDGNKFPELVLEKPLDREKQDIHRLILTAFDGGNPVRSGTTLLKVIVVDANDNAPIFKQKIYKVNLKENIPVNSTVIMLNATDNDEGINAQITYSFIKTSGNIHHTGIFSINSTNGEIKINENLDVEVMKNYELSVQARDGGGLVAHCKVLLEVLDVNDNAPEISITSLSSPIPEDSAPGTMIALIEVHDQDSGDNADVDCQILEDVPFNLLSSNTYYRLVLSAAIDREKTSSYNISIIATDRGSPPLSSTRVLTLDVSDVNDNPPIFSKSTYVAYVPENNLPGASIFSIQASDPDTGDNARIIYSISSAITETPSMTSYLSINIETGVLYAQRSFDYEQNKEFIIEVTASDNGSPSLSSNVTLFIHIVDQNDNAQRSYTHHQILVVVMVKDNGNPSLSSSATLSLIIADDFQQVVPKLSNKLKDEEIQSNLQFYLVVGLALISLLFIITVMAAIISKCKQPKPLPAFSSLTTNLYPPIDPRTFSMYSDGSLPLPYSYNMCVALDPTEGDFTYMNPSGNVPVENLIDADNTEQGTECLKETSPSAERSGTTLLKIIVIDGNDNAPLFSQDIYKINLKENIPVNSTVIILNATDNDEGINAQITYSFMKTSRNIHHTGIFSINPNTGEIKIIVSLNFKVTKNYELSVQAKDGGGLVAHCKVLVEVIDVNDNAPEISITSLSSPIPEDSAPGTMIALIEVHDQDSGDNADVDCQILEDVPFNLLSSNTYYRLVLSAVIDREKTSSYNISIIATDRGSPPLSSTQILTLDVSDVNDNPPIFSKSTYVAYVPENNLPGASIFSIQASDPDTGDNARIIYSISSAITETPSMTSYLSINIETGVLYAQRSFDYEQNKEFIIEVTASDNGSPSLSSNVTLFIHIVDQNDNAPKILYPSPDTGGLAVFELVPFVSEPGSLITKVVAVDADSGHNSWLSYHFIQLSDSIHFVISEYTGEIRTSRIFQEKDILNYKVVVIVKDNGHPTLSATTTLSLIIADDFQQVVPKLSNKLKDEETQSNLQFFLVVGLALISLLFIITVMVAIISKCKQPKPLPAFSSLTTNLYPPIDPRTFSMYSDGSLPLPYSYNMCVALDPAEGDFTYMNPSGNVPVENLIDADNTEQGTECHNEASLSTEQVRCSNFLPVV
ncbi:unnamed protein product [Ranitomeya imitator]|uniref:Cadherin domain-containing protein n=1 Tax=Ranitomeya imitator TaxID=111125 RepID=A0ABN9LGI2_9NEOB|nr:unnamed protein product [Ranitomeya imitator]